MSSGLAKFSSVQAKHAPQTVSRPITEGGACFLSSGLLPCLCGNNQREQGLGLFSSFFSSALIFHGCPLLFVFRLFDARKRLWMQHIFHPFISFDPKKCPVCRHRKGGSFAFSYKRSQCLDLESVLDQWEDKRERTCR